MATGSRPPKRPVVGSRNPTGRPRKLAGRREAAPPTAPEPESEAAETPEPDEPPHEEELPPPSASEQLDSDDPTAAPVPDDERPGRFSSPVFTSRRSTVVLAGVLVLLIGLLAVEIWYVSSDDEPVVSSDRPVVTGEIASKSAVDAAAQSTQDILTYGYHDFDAQTDEATAKMTDTFAAKYRETAAGVRDEFIKNKTEQEVRVVGQSVVQASSEKVLALIFLDHYVTRAGQSTSVTPYRALVTMVHTDNGWLVDGIETQ